MRFSSLFGPAAAEFASIIRCWPILLSTLVPLTQGANLTPVPSPNLDLSPLGRVALAGNFDAISLYKYAQQSEGFSTNGTQSLITALPDGGFASLVSADAHIQAMCPFVLKDGTLAGIVLGGNFTSLGGIEMQAVALVDPSSAKITPLPGLSGQVSALLCDQDTSTVYVGGDFKGGNSTNAIAWVGMTGWANLPFAGFNGPVTSVTKAPSGHIVFGGSFDGLGNATTPARKNQQVINLSSAKISAGSTTTTTGFSDPSNIVCKTNGQDGAGNTWLLSDNEPGYWRADMQFGFQPTILRLWNTQQDGRGTKTFRFTAAPVNGIMNLTYTDPATGNLAACDATCPLPDNTTYQDFHFVNTIGMNGFQIDISAWYGAGGGLDGVELFEDDIFAYAVNDFNEPSCANIQLGSNATVTGAWSVTPSGQSTAEYLSANIGASGAGPSSVVFKPDIKQTGNYSVIMYTPGCIQDGTCATRGIVNVTATFATGTQASQPVQTQIFQTNNFEKYDQLYLGYVDANRDSFRPTVSLTAAAGQGNINVVASRVRFQLISSTGGLNGLFEFDPNQAVVSTDFSTSAINRAGTELQPGATITSLVTNGQTIYAGGSFSDAVFENIMAFSNNNASSLPDGGLNAEVAAMFSLDDLLYLGGNFTNTSKPGIGGLSNVAAYSYSKNSWVALGAGLNGRVNTIVPLQLNITQNKPETTIAFSGDFSQILAFGKNQAVSAQGLAVWVPSQNSWLQNLNIPKPALEGQLSTSVNVPNAAPLLAGTLSSQGMSASGAVSLSGSSNLGLNSLPINIQPSQAQSSHQKRATTGQNIAGVTSGLFYNNGGRNVTILGGHFTAKATNGSTIQNLLFLNGSNNDAVTGLTGGVDPGSVILAMAVQSDTLFAGGTITGQVAGSSVNGLVLYDLLHADYMSPQPQAFTGKDVVVNSITARPTTSEVYIGGKFDAAGSLPCKAVCLFNVQNSQFTKAGTNLDGTVVGLTWAGSSKLVAAGNLTVDGNSTFLASYDPKAETWSVVTGAVESNIPGPVTAFTPGKNDGSNLWVAGTATNGSTYLINWDGKNYNAVGDVLGTATSIRGLQVLGLSKDHSDTQYLDNDQALLVTGDLQLPNFGHASAALFNGTTFTPFILSTTDAGQPGSLSQLFSEKTNTLKGGHRPHSTGIIVLVSLCCALGCEFILILIGVIINKVQKRRSGYVPVNGNGAYTDKHSNFDRVPPEHLFQGLHGQKGSGAPMV